MGSADASPSPTSAPRRAFANDDIDPPVLFSALIGVGIGHRLVFVLPGDGKMLRIEPMTFNKLPGETGCPAGRMLPASFRENNSKTRKRLIVQEDLLSVFKVQAQSHLILRQNSDR